jgi:hypothetical protein
MHLKNSKNNMQNSHYFLYLCTLLSSNLLEKFFLVRFLTKKIKKKEKFLKYCLISIQYLISIFFLIKALWASFKKTILFFLSKKCINNNFYEKQILKNIIILFNNQLGKYLYYFFSVYKSSNHFKNEKYIKRKLCSYFQFYFSKKLKVMLFHFTKVGVCFDRFTTLSYNQLLKISNQYKFISKINKNQICLNFGLSVERNIQNIKSYSYSVNKKMESIYSISFERLNKLKKLYIKRKIFFSGYNSNKENILFFYFCRQLVKGNLSSNKERKKIQFNKFIIQSKKNSWTISKKIIIYIKTWICLNERRKVSKIDSISIQISRLWVFSIITYSDTLLKCVIVGQFENNENIPLNSKIKLISNSVISKKKKLLILFFLKKKKIIKQRYNFKIRNILIQNFKVINIINTLDRKILEILKTINTVNFFLPNVPFLILQIFTLKKILFYDTSSLKSISFLKSKNYKICQSQEKRPILERIIYLEKSIEELQRRLVCPNNSVKNQMIMGLYEKLNCPIIKYLPKEVVLYQCGHLFSSKCIKNLITSRHRKCPLCGKSFSIENIKQIFLL